MASKQKPTLVEEILRTGFLLEHQTAAEFRRVNYQVERNLLLPSRIPSNEYLQRLAEIDVLARFRHGHGRDSVFITECKGASPKDKLVFLPVENNSGYLLQAVFTKQVIQLNTDNGLRSDGDAKSGLYLCHNGDFFEEIDNGFKRASTQEERSNFYKGIVQLYYALDAVYIRFRDEAEIVVWPLIVTNAEIHVVDFADGTPESTKTIPVPWVAYRNPLTYTSTSSSIGAVDWKDAVGPSGKPIHPMRIPTIWVVNLKALKSFLVSNSKMYRDADIWERLEKSGRV
jgi:hypothetical protein